MNKFLTILFIFISFKTAAFVQLDIGLIHKKGIDKKLVLESEFHIREDIMPENKRDFKTKDGLRFEISPRLISSPSDLGPNVEVEITGVIFHSDGRLIKKFSSNELFLKLGEKKELEFDQIEGQLIKLEVEANL